MTYGLQASISFQPYFMKTSISCMMGPWSFLSQPHEPRMFLFQSSRYSNICQAPQRPQIPKTLSHPQASLSSMMSEQPKHYTTELTATDSCCSLSGTTSTKARARCYKKLSGSPPGCLQLVLGRPVAKAGARNIL